jgi:hypothetical protein
MHLKSSGVVIANDCHWTSGLYLAVGNMGGSQSVIVEPDEIDQLISDLTRIRAAIAGRAHPQEKAA